MLIRCAWCGRIIGDKPPYGGRWDREVTDGICEKCARRYFAPYFETKGKEGRDNVDEQKEIRRSG